MLKIKQIVVGQLQANCYLVYDEKTLDTIIVDPGDDADLITRVVADLELNPQSIIATHGHFDHVLAVTELKLAYNIPFLMHAKDQFLLERMESSAKYYTKAPTVPSPLVDKFLVEGESVFVGKLALEVIETPGHTPGSICLYSKEESFILVGDLVFQKGGVGRTDFAYSNQGDLVESVEKILKLPGNTIICSGHGDATTISAIREYFDNILS